MHSFSEHTKILRIFRFYVDFVYAIKVELKKVCVCVWSNLLPPCSFQLLACRCSVKYKTTTTNYFFPQRLNYLLSWFQRSMRKNILSAFLLLINRSFIYIICQQHELSTKRCSYTDKHKEREKKKPITALSFVSQYAISNLFIAKLKLFLITEHSYENIPRIFGNNSTHWQIDKLYR